MSTVAELAFTLARDALAKQDAALDELRTRTGTLLAASSLVASFFGARAIDRSQFSWPNIIALVSFGAAALFSVYVLFPRSGVARSLSGPAVYEYFEDLDVDIDEVYRDLAYWIQGAYATNAAIVRPLSSAFRLGCVALIGEVVFWAVGLGVH
jgi:hypothetical protein